jgi:hypothetical protein
MLGNATDGPNITNEQLPSLAAVSTDNPCTLSFLYTLNHGFTESIPYTVTSQNLYSVFTTSMLTEAQVPFTATNNNFCMLRTE